MQPYRIGLIGLDTSHVVGFARTCNDPSSEAHRADARVVAGFAGGSADVPLSRDRVDGYARQLREEYGVALLDSPEAVAEACDIVFIESIDGRVHLDHLQRTLPWRRPTFIDKPMAHSPADARRMFELADAAGVPLMSSSPLRYAQPLSDALGDAALGAVVGCDAFGPIKEVDIPPGLFWYGIHAAEILFAALGAGCARVRATYHPQGELIVGAWSDGRLGSIRGLRQGHGEFGATIHRERGFQQPRFKDGTRHYYDLMLDAILRNLPRGRSDVPRQQTLEIMRFLEAANQSRRTGESVDL